MEGRKWSRVVEIQRSGICGGVGMNEAKDPSFWGWSPTQSELPTSSLLQGLQLGLEALDTSLTFPSSNPPPLRA